MQLYFIETFYKYLMRTYNLWQGFQIIKMYDLDRDFQTVSFEKISQNYLDMIMSVLKFNDFLIGLKNISMMFNTVITKS